MKRVRTPKFDTAESLAARNQILAIFLELERPRSFGRLRERLLELKTAGVYGGAVPSISGLKKWAREAGWIEILKSHDAEVHRRLVELYAKRTAEGKSSLAERLETYAALAIDKAIERVDTMSGYEMVISALAALKQVALMTGEATERLQVLLGEQEMSRRKARLARYKQTIEGTAEPAPLPAALPATKINGSGNGHNGSNGSASGTGH